MDSTRNPIYSYSNSKTVEKYIILAILILGAFSASAQTVKGTVVDEEMAILEGAYVIWAGTDIGTTTSDFGEFELNADAIEDKRLVISFLGYQNDTIPVTGDADFFIQLKPDGELSEVVVEGRQTGGHISSSSVGKVEIINNVELGKAACCDLAGCFNNNASVEPATTNIVTNSRELRILGLSGVYNQVLLDGFPLIQGLSFPYGVSSVPGPFVENIMVAKGTTSVLQGSESISGQINVLLKKPVDAPDLHLNYFMNSFWEKQFNAYATQEKGKFANVVGAHMVLPAGKFDHNNDGFLDLPKLTRYQIFDKFKIGNDTENGWFTRGGLRFTNESRTGGQVDFDPDTDLGSSSVYGQQMDYNQFDIWNRTAYRFNEFHATALIASGQYHAQEAWFGETLYDGTQSLFNITAQHEFIYENGSNLRAGASFKYLDIDEDISFTANPLNKTYAGSYETKEVIPGIFAENTLFLAQDKLTLMTGIRADHLNNNIGWKVSPRMMMKYTPAPNTDIRASAGYGWHTPKVFSEQARVLGTQRDIHFHGVLQPDEAWNYGINITQKVDAPNLAATFSADFYQTRFTNHVLAHYHAVHDAIVFENNRKPAVGNGFQAEATLELWQWLTLKSAYNFLDIQHTDLEGNKGTMDFITKHRLLNSVSINPKERPWHFDVSCQWYGIKKLPDTDFYPDNFRQADYSDPYTMLNAQFTYKWKDFEFYTGAENILNFTLDNPIISSDDPFNPFFDTSFAWGPTRGIEGYIGMRYNLNVKKGEE